MRIGSLFTGCGGLDLGLELAGYQTVWACESDPACQRVLEHRFPGVPIVDDVRDVDETLPGVDVLAGGFPCQDLSYAGKGAGLDGDRSGLWHEFARAVRVLRPRHVIVENVSALSNRGLGRVLYDLAEAGYVGSWGCVRASDVGAPHRRAHRRMKANLPGGARTAIASLSVLARAGFQQPDDPLLPTPRTTDATGAGEHGQGGPDLSTTIQQIGASTSRPSPAGSTSPGPPPTQPTSDDGSTPASSNSCSASPTDGPKSKA